MLPAGFLRQQWPQWHEHLVEECVAGRGVLHVSDVLNSVDPGLLAMRWEWTLRGPLPLRLVVRQAGPFKRWWIECPRCSGRRDALYLPPDATKWACRECHGLIYATQRHGFRHPLRKVLTHRKRIGERREMLRQQRRWRRAASRWEPVIPDPEMDAAIEWALRLHAALAARRVSREAESPMVRDGDGTPQSEDLGAIITAQTERALARLRELANDPRSKPVRQRARRKLEEYEGRDKQNARGAPPEVSG
jgi:hypothetical protein